MIEQLALDGGPRDVSDSLPGFLSATGRTFGQEEESFVIEAVRSGCLSRNGGTTVKGLEWDFARALGVFHAVACPSGTACVHLAVAALDLEPDDEIIGPAVTDIGSIPAGVWQNAIPVFADVNLLTLVLEHFSSMCRPKRWSRRSFLSRKAAHNRSRKEHSKRKNALEPAEVKKRIAPHSRAVIAVHLAGMRCPMDELKDICRERGVAPIGDCSQANWAEYRGKLYRFHSYYGVARVSYVQAFFDGMPASRLVDRITPTVKTV